MAFIIKKKKKSLLSKTQNQQHHQHKDQICDHHLENYQLHWSIGGISENLLNIDEDTNSDWIQAYMALDDVLWHGME